MKRQPIHCLFVLIAWSACSSNNVSGDADDMFAEVCDSAFRCCSRGEIDDILGPFVAEENCVERLSRVAEVNGGLVLYALPLESFGFLLPNIELLRKAVKQGRAEFVGKAVDECLAHLAEIPCNDPDAEEEVEGCVPREPPEVHACAFNRLIRGKVGKGGNCTSTSPSFECKEGFTCIRISSQATEGLCVEAGQVGDFCYEDVECDSGLFCNVLDGRCEEPRAAGEPCEFVDPDDLSPDPRPVSDGGDVVIRCQSHLSCDPIFDLCVPDCVQGAPCLGPEDCNEEEGLQCIVSAGRGRCDFQRDVGLPCASDDNCKEGLFCGPNPAKPAESLCLEKLANGRECARPGHCESGYCRDNAPDPDTCAPRVADGEPCPTRDHDQCESGYCEVRNVDEIAQADQFPSGNCSGDEDCPGSSTCDLDRFRCVELCRARAADGVSCGFDEECLSENCVGVAFFTPGTCQTIPLPDGQNCSSPTQCESEFCNPANGVCQTPPLDNGEPCFSDTVCASGVCDGVCVTGLTEGADCSLERCARELYCDRTITPNLCVPKLEPGELCQQSLQCHGACQEIFGRFRCDPTPPSDAAICDGE